MQTKVPVLKANGYAVTDDREYVSVESCPSSLARVVLEVHGYRVEVERDGRWASADRPLDLGQGRPERGAPA